MNLTNILTLFIISGICTFFISISADEISTEDARKMTTKQLRTALYKRGLECKGCAEKDDFVKMFIENQHLPVKDDNQSSDGSFTASSRNDDEETEEGKAKKKKEIDELLAKMKTMPGMGGAKMFTKDDLDKMGKDGTFPGMGRDENKKKAKKSKPKKKESEEIEVEL